MVPVSLLLCFIDGEKKKKHVADSQRGEDAESHTGLAPFSTIYKKQMSQNRAGSRPGIHTDTPASC